MDRRMVGWKNPGRCREPDGSTVVLISGIYYWQFACNIVQSVAHCFVCQMFWTKPSVGKFLRPNKLSFRIFKCPTVCNRSFLN